MTAYVFVGPTLARTEIEAARNVVCLPPVALGDVYRVAQAKPRAIGIVDGYFEGVPSVWHKEILWAMAQGIHVFGSASMGALRAAELHAFGMRGVGRIFDWYCDGTFEDDDEVAVLHGPAEAGYVALSEPMVNMRTTLETAIQQEVITPGTGTFLEEAAKGLFYQERHWETLLDHPAAKTLPANELAALRAWLPRGRVDVKREDALAMLGAMDELLADDTEPKRVTYHLEWTTMWDDATHATATVVGADVGTEALAHDRLLDELRLQGEAFQSARQRALLRLLSRREADRRKRDLDHATLGAVKNRFRLEHGLFSRAEIERWLAANDVDAEAFELLMADEARLDELTSWAEGALDQHLLADLRLTGNYPRLAERARAKARVLATQGFDDPEPQDVGLTPVQLRAWYFEQRLARPLPDDVERSAQNLGFASTTDFDRAVLREYLYSMHKGDAQELDENIGGG